MRGSIALVPTMVCLMTPSTMSRLGVFTSPHRWRNSWIITDLNEVPGWCVQVIVEFATSSIGRNIMSLLEDHLSYFYIKNPTKWHLYPNDG
jgi:hypothetical protein